MFLRSNHRFCRAANSRLCLVGKSRRNLSCGGNWSHEIDGATRWGTGFGADCSDMHRACMTAILSSLKGRGRTSLCQGHITSLFIWAASCPLAVVLGVSWIRSRLFKVPV
ncbi:unnamed protein product [Urochloa humidicola]